MIGHRPDWAGRTSSPTTPPTSRQVPEPQWQRLASSSAPIGRDAALVGLGADIKVTSWPVAMFVDYGGAISGSSNAQSFNAGLRFIW